MAAESIREQHISLWQTMCCTLVLPLIALACWFGRLPGWRHAVACQPKQYRQALNTRQGQGHMKACAAPDLALPAAALRLPVASRCTGWAELRTSIAFSMPQVHGSLERRGWDAPWVRDKQHKASGAAASKLLHNKKDGRAVTARLAHRKYSYAALRLGMLTVTEATSAVWLLTSR